MHILQKDAAPRYKRPEGIVSYLLASARTSDAKQLTTTLVEIDPGGSQRAHSHAPEQIYFIIEGSGRMTVAAESANVSIGDCVFIPSGTPHGLTNNGSGLLRYFSAAAPTFNPQELTDFWPLEPEASE